MKASRTTDTSIYIAVNSNVPCAEAPGYRTLQVGSALAREHFGMVRDDDGENISELNKSFCELTGLYWIWKHDNSHIVGLTHYRRYFAPKHHRGFPFNDREIAHVNDFTDLNLGIDLIVATPVRWRTGEVPLSSLQQYSETHQPHDLFLAREEILALTPEYKDAFDFVRGQHAISHHNMFVGRKAVLDEYCEWLFPMLFALEKIIPYIFYDGYQTRVFGYLGERLFNVWLCKHRRRYRTIYRDIVRTEVNIF